MTSQPPPWGPARVLRRGLGYGAGWGAALGAAVVLVLVVDGLVVNADIEAIGAVVIYPAFAVIPGAIVGVVVGALASLALIVSGPNVRRDRVKSRIVGGAASAIPGVVGFVLAAEVSTVSQGWAGLAVGTVIAIIAGAALAPRVAMGKAGTGAHAAARA